MRGTPSASAGRARGPRDASGYAIHGRVAPRHMITGSSSLLFSLGIKVTTPAERVSRNTPGPEPSDLGPLTTGGNETEPRALSNGKAA
jgi:hypothetical protein